jgi:hypothetical protein
MICALSILNFTSFREEIQFFFFTLSPSFSVKIIQVLPQEDALFLEIARLNSFYFHYGQG